MRGIAPLVAATFFLIVSPSVRAQLPENSAERAAALKERAALQKQIDKLLDERKYDGAIAALHEAVALDKKIDGAASKTVHFTMIELVEQCFMARDHVAEAKAYAELLPMTAKLFGEKHWRTVTVRRRAERADVLLKLGKDNGKWIAISKGESRGFEAFQAGKFYQAIEIWNETILLTEGLFAKKSYQYATNLQLLGFAYYRSNQFKRAIETFEETVELDVELFGEPHPETATNRSFLGAVYRFNGQPTKAEPHLLKSVRDVRQIVEEGGLSKEFLFSTLRGLSSFYLEQQDIGRMRPFTVEARALAEKVFTKLSPQYSSTLLDAIALHTEAIEFAKAALALDEALEILPKVYKAPHPELATLQLRAAQLYKAQGQFELAKEAVEKGLKIHEGLRNPDRLGVFQLRNLLGLIALDLARGDDAVAIFEEVLKEAKAMSGERSTRYAASLHNLALAHWRAGSFSNAEKYYKEALAVKEMQEKDSLDCAITLDGLGGLYLGVQDFPKAEPLLIKAAEIRLKRLGDKHPYVGSCYNDLGVFYLDRGDLRKAKHYLTKAVELYKSASPNHPMTAKSLDNLAKYYGEMQDVEKAVELWKDALDIRRAIYPEDHPDLIVGINNMAGGYWSLVGKGIIKDAFAKTEELYREAIRLTEKSKRYSKAETAVIWQNLGAILILVPTRREEAIAAYDRAMKVWEQYEAQTGRKIHHQKIDLLNALCTVRIQDNKPQEAMALAAEAVRIARAIYGSDGKQLDTFLLKQHIVMHTCGKEKEANELLRELIGIHDQIAGDVLGFASEKDLLEFFSSRLVHTYHRVIQRAADNPEDAKAVEFALELACRRQGIILDRICEARELERQLSLAQNKSLHDDINAFRGKKKNLADSVLNPRAENNPAVVRKLQRETEELQSNINRRLFEILPQRQVKVDIGGLRSKLAPKSALVEFVRTDIVEFPLGDKGFNRVEKYVALVLPADPKRPVQIFDLGPAEKIDEAVTAVRGRLKVFEPEDEVREERAYRKASSALYDLIFKDLQPALAGVESLVIVPDGQLYRVPFAALVDAEKKYLVESLSISVVPSCRDLLRDAAKGRGNGVVVFANPDYDNGQSPVQKNPPILVATRGPSPEFSGLGWKRLPGTAKEARAIERAMGGGDYGRVLSFEDKVATEEEVKNVNSPRILHLATHGTYVEKIENQQVSDLRSVGSRQTIADNPLLRSALIMAGANKPAAADADDGFLTAEEVSMLNLRGTELVVLSACESGLGEVRSGEGVFGMHRAFIHAGARTIVVSLYPVPDTETGEVMKRFYEGLAAKKSKAEALHSAQLGYLRERRGEKGDKPAHPLFWAAFVLIGDGK